MPSFKVVLVEHGYSTSKYERDIVAAAGGEFIDANEMPLDQALKLCEDAEGILVRRITVDADMIRRFRKCRIIVRYGVGTDNVDVDAATAAGIVVGNVPDYCLDEVSTHAFALLLACIRDIPATHNKMASGGWDVKRDVPVHRMRGRTLGIIGLGGIGQAFAEKALGWGMKIISVDPFVERHHSRRLGVEMVDIDTGFAQSDFISLHCPLLPETYHLVSHRALESMKHEAILVNTARGGIVDTEALLNALDVGQISMAALDVHEEEPLPVSSALRHHPRVILTDHMAWYSLESQIQLQMSAAKQIVSVCTGGLPLSLANPEVLVALGRFDEWKEPECMRWRLKRAGLI
jgi:D-3-phosphoglycerate dehydrogenase